MSLAFKAMVFAREVHKQQERKYTGNPYTDHLAEVAGIVATIADVQVVTNPSIVIATAWLHDCMEDQGVTPYKLRAALHDCSAIAEEIEEVVNGVILLSDLEEGNRATRKAASCIRLSNAPAWVQDIKCADFISNTKSIVKHDPSFAKLYIKEKRATLEMMSKANPDLMKLAYCDTF